MTARGLEALSYAERKTIRDAVARHGLQAAAFDFCVHPSTLTKALAGLPVRRSVAVCLRARLQTTEAPT